jgi:hypothetical protein
MTTNWDISKTLNTLISEKNEIFRELQCVIVVWRQMRTFAVVYGEKNWMRLWCPLYSTPTRFSRIFIVLGHWNKKARIDMSFQMDTLSWFRTNKSSLLILNAACIAEKQHVPIYKPLVLTEPGLDHTIYSTRG